MLRNIHLHGALGEKYGREFRLSVKTAGEAVRALHVNFPGFIDDVQQGSYEIIRGEVGPKGLWLDIDDLNDFNLGNADLHIVPAIEGSSKGGGVIKTVLGVALVGGALAFSGGSLAAPLAASGLMSGMTFGNLAMVGLALTVAGVASLLTPPKVSTSDQSSARFTGPQNTYAQGNPVPLVYGRVITGSVMISCGMDVEPIPVGWSPSEGNTITGDGNISTGDGTNAFYTGPLEKITFNDGTFTYSGTS